MRGQIHIPATLTNMPVKFFNDSASIRTVRFADGTEAIAEGLLEDMSRITAVTIPDTVVTIGARSIKGTSITELALSKKLAVIEDSAFENCTKLTTVTWHDHTLEKIGSAAFKGCTAVKGLTLTQENTNDSSANTSAESAQIIELPDSVTVIGAEAFLGLKLPQKLIWSRCLTELGANAFSGCTRISVVRFADSEEVMHILEIPASLEQCGVSPLTDADITSAVWEEGSDKILSNIVQGTGITSVEVPKTVLSIQDNAFRNCTKLVAIDIPKSVTSIGAAAFQECSALEDAVIPKFVTDIGGSDNIFDGAVRLTIRGVVGSNINTYADTYGIPFERLISTCTLAEDSFDIPKGESVILSITDLWPGEEPVFTSDDRTVAETAPNGIVTGTGVGATTLNVNIDNSYFATATIQVCSPMKELALDFNEMELHINDMEAVIVSYLPEDTTDQKTARYSIADPTIASVDENGNVTALALGETTLTITATATTWTAEAGYGKTEISTNCTIKVIPDDQLKKHQKKLPNPISVITNVCPTTGDIDEDLLEGWSFVTASEQISLENGGVNTFAIEYIENGYETLTGELTVTATEITDLSFINRIYRIPLAGSKPVLFTATPVFAGAELPAGLYRVDYTSSDESVALINVTTGEITPQGIGTCSMTASLSILDNHKSVVYSDLFTVSVPVTVSASTATARPRIESSYILNLVQGKTRLNIDAVYGTDIESVSLTGDDAEKFRISKENNGFYIRPNGTVGKKNYKKLTLSVKLIGSAEAHEKAITVKVINEMPKITIKQNGSINLFDKTASASFKVSGKYMNIADIRISSDAADASFFTITYDRESRTGTIQQTAKLDSISNLKSLTKAQKSLTLTAVFDEYPDTANQKITLNVKTAYKAPSLSIKEGKTRIYSLQSLNTLMTVYNKTTKTNLTDYTISTGAMSGFFTAGYDTESGKLRLTALNSTLKKYTVPLAIRCPEWRADVIIKQSVEVTDKLPEIKLSTTKIPLNSQLAPAETASVNITVPNGDFFIIKDIVVEGAGSEQFRFQWESGRLLVGCKEGSTPANGNYKLTASAIFDNDTPSLKKNFTISVHNKTPQIKLSAKGSIDILNPYSAVYYTPKLTNVSGTITDVSLSGSNAEAFRADLLEDNRIQLTLARTQNSNAKITANTQYSLQFYFTLDNSLTLTNYQTTVNIKPIQSKAKVTASSTKLTMDYFEKELDFTLTKPETAEIERVVLADTQNFNYSYDAKALTLKDNNNLTAGKTYTLQFNVFCKTEAKTTNPITVKVKVTIPK